MNDSTRFLDRLRRAWPPRGRTAAIIVVVAALAAAGTVIGVVQPFGAGNGSPSSTSSGGSSDAGGSTNAHSSSSQSALAFSQCMRSHGVPNYPDPDSSGELPKTSAQQLGISVSEFQAAQRACQHLLRNAGSLNANSLRQCELTGDCPQALVQQALTEMRRFSQCMRSHGVPNFPDPTTGPNDAPFFDASGAGITDQESHSWQFTNKLNQCAHVMPDTGGVPMG